MTRKKSPSEGSQPRKRSRRKTTASGTKKPVRKSSTSRPVELEKTAEAGQEREPQGKAPEPVEEKTPLSAAEEPAASGEAAAAEEEGESKRRLEAAAEEEKIAPDQTGAEEAVPEGEGAKAEAGEMPPESEAAASGQQPPPAPEPSLPPAQPEPEAESSVNHWMPATPPMYIVQISPELAPVAKVGGLADVVFGLSNELELRGNHVEIILPKYDCLRYDHIWDLAAAYEDLWVPWYGGAIHCTVYFGHVHGRKCYFIEPHSQDNFFNRGCVYGFNDDTMRFAFFCRAAMEFLFKAGKHPDIIHCHDWQTALVPVLLYEIYQHLGMTHPRVCYTIHNFKHQGVVGADVLHATGLNRPEYYFHYDRLQDNWNPHALNLMKGGIVYSNFVTTVSPTYAVETKDGGQGFGLEPTLHIHHQKYGGVVNGIDYNVWNPEIDHHIPVNYGLDNLDDKYRNKIALRHRLMLADNEKPIVAFIGRLDPQKGLELVRHAIFYTLQQYGQFVLLGSSPDEQINGYFWGLKHELNESPDCHLEIGFDEELSHLIYAGADMILVPSRFEPCGLTQLIAMRYGTIPVVRQVGGLADTVHDKDFSDRPLHERNGYVFRDYDYPGLESALGRAIRCYYDFPEHFRELMKNAMRCDYSWKHPGQDYLNIYDFIREK